MGEKMQQYMMNNHTFKQSWKQRKDGCSDILFNVLMDIQDLAKAVFKQKTMMNF